jgi:hypothetical protein
VIDGGVGADIAAIVQNIAEAEVVTLHFPMLRQTLLLDGRSDDEEGPLVAVVPMVNSSAERLASLRRLRPRFARPASLSMIPWTQSVECMRREGVWDAVLARLASSGGGGEAGRVLADAQRALARLRALELVEIRQAIVGVEYRTVWGRAGAGDPAQ